MNAFDYVRKKGLGTSFMVGRSRWHLVIGFVTAAAAAFLLMGAVGITLLAGALIVSLAMGRWISTVIGGMTGDTYGAVNEVAEVCVLLLAIFLYSLVGSLFEPPLW